MKAFLLFGGVLCLSVGFTAFGIFLDKVVARQPGAFAAGATAPPLILIGTVFLAAGYAV